MRTVLYLALSTLWTILTSDAKAVTTADNSEVDKRDCRPRLKAQIQICLLRFEGLLVVYQRPGTSETQRHAMLTDMCHQYEETLQCLHVSLLRCVADQPSLQLIASRLGPVRTFMEVTCYITLRRVTPTPETPPMTPATSHSPSTTETLVRTTATALPRTSTEHHTEDMTTTGSKQYNTTLQTTSTTTDIPTTTTTEKQTVSRTIPLTTPANIKPKLRTNMKDLLGAKTEQSLVGNLAMTDSINCEDMSLSERRLRCLQQRQTVNAASAVTMCRYTIAHLGALIAVIMITVFLQ